MLKTILITFAAFLTMFAFLAIGYVFQRKQIQGRCGGITALGLKKECDSPEPCDNRKKQLLQIQEKADREKG